MAGQSALVALDGWTIEDMAVRKSLALHVYWPAMTLNPTPREQVRDKAGWQSLEDQAKQRAARLRALDDFFQDARAYAQAKAAAASNQAQAPTPDPTWEALLPFVRGERPLVVHADEGADSGGGDVGGNQSLANHSRRWPRRLAGGGVAGQAPSARDL